MNLHAFRPLATPRARRNGAVALWLGLMACASPCAAADADALQRTNYQSFSGDVNGDGRTDVLLKARPKGMLIPVGDEVEAVIAIPPASPSFVLLSDANGGHTLVANPDAAMLGSSVWLANSHELVRGASGLQIKARTPNGSDFLVTMSASGNLQLLQELPALAQTAFQQLLSTTPAKSATRTSSFEYDPGSGLLMREIIEPDTPQLRLETAYTYDVYGNRTGVSVSSPATGAAAIPGNSSSTSFDASGRFPLASSNALNHNESRTFDAKTGQPTSLTGPNGLTTQWQYDSFGRKTREIRADGNGTKWEYLFCSGVNAGRTACPALAKYLIKTTPLAKNGLTVNGPWSKRYFDELDRQISAETPGFDGTSVITVNTEHDRLGRVYRTSRPAFAGQALNWTTSTYDAIGRTVATSLPDNSRSTLSFNGLSTSSTNALNQTQTRIVNSQGQPVQIIDPLGQSLSYQHDPFGNLIRTTDPNGNVIVNRFDVRGRKELTGDADMGVWTYQYDALSRLVQQTDAKGQITVNLYDRLGRPIGRSEADLITHWNYDACANGVGKLCAVDSGASAAGASYTMTPRYDAYGRAESTTTNIDAAYAVGVTFDANGRVATQTYPTGFAVRYVYSPLGYLKEVRNNASNALYWRVQTQDAEGHLLLRTLGNLSTIQQTFDPASGRLKSQIAGAAQNIGYDYDALGNLTGRSDAIQNVNESFQYDGLNRLTGSTVSSSAAGQITLGTVYDSIGNIIDRGGVGRYTYGSVNNRPHALSELAGVSGGRRKYEYDANGNSTREIQFDAGGNVVADKARSAVYTSFNMPQTLSAQGNSSSFAYGPDHQRIKQTAATGTTIYLHPDNQGGMFYEKEIKPDGRVEHEHFISAGGQVVAVVKQAGSSSTVRYFHRDGLGSTVAVSDASGNVLERLSYEPFGKRRYPNGASDASGALSGVNTDRGFTNHEHLDELGLIHMNGRIYDPLTARFMSADPNVQAADNLQSYNRYSYVWNNPLNATDPTGYFAMPTSRDVFNVLRRPPGHQSVDRVMLKYPALQAIGQIAAATFGGPWAAAGFSAYVAGLNGGGPNDMFRAAAISYGTAAAFTAVGDTWNAGTAENVAGHAGVGCASAVASGGNCGAGAMSAAMPAAVSSVDGFGKAGNVVVLSMIGGAASVAGGGRFADGALTAAFGYLFNDLLHKDILAGRCTTPSNACSQQNAQYDAAYDRQAKSQAVEPVIFEDMLVGGVARRSVGNAAETFFEGTRYSERVLGQMKNADFHGFPRSVETFAHSGAVSLIVQPSTQVVKQMLQIPGSYGGRSGVFEFIKHESGVIYHRLFKPN